MADTSPPVPGHTEAAFPVPGGWVQVAVSTTFTPADHRISAKPSPTIAGGVSLPACAG